MEVPAFQEGRYTTHFIQNHGEELKTKDNCSETCVDLAAITAFVDFLKKLKPVSSNGSAGASQWKAFGRKKAVTRL
jgi:hypothetical protein